MGCSSNVYWQTFDVTRKLRALIKNQEACCLWMTGLSGAGKTSIARLLEATLYEQGKHTYILDGDNIRHGLNSDLGFTNIDRTENIRRVAEVSNLMVDAGLIVIVSFISPFLSDREMAKSIHHSDNFFELYIDSPVEICEARDVKGLYAKARSGQLKNFTGIDSAYEPPINPDLHLLTQDLGVEDAVSTILDFLKRKKIV